MQIRRYQPGDATPLADLMFRAVHEIGVREYDRTQLRAWMPEAPGASTIESWALDGRLFFVAADENDHLLGFGDLKADGHIDHLFVHPDAAGKGVASALYDALERRAIETGLTLLYVEASETALPLFSRKGFSVTERRELTVRDTPIHNYAMSKSL